MLKGYNITEDGKVLDLFGVHAKTRVDMMGNVWIEAPIIGKNLHQNVVWTAFNGQIPPRHSVAHVNGDKSNNHIKNLILLGPEETYIEAINQWSGEERKSQIPTEVYTAQGEFICLCATRQHASFITEISTDNIRRCINGERNFYRGLTFKNYRGDE